MMKIVYPNRPEIPLTHSLIFCAHALTHMVSHMHVLYLSHDHTQTKIATTESHRKAHLIFSLAYRKHCWLVNLISLHVDGILFIWLIHIPLWFDSVNVGL